jgi:hypothetical protein
MDMMDDNVRWTLYAQPGGRVHVLLEGVVLTMNLAPFMELLTRLVSELKLDPVNTVWFERWEGDGWSMLTTAWRDGRCIRVDWNSINPDTAWALVKGVSAEPVMA